MGLLTPGIEIRLYKSFDCYLESFIFVLLPFIFASLEGCIKIPYGSERPSSPFCICDYCHDASKKSWSICLTKPAREFLFVSESTIYGAYYLGTRVIKMLYPGMFLDNLNSILPQNLFEGHDFPNGVTSYHCRLVKRKSIEFQLIISVVRDHRVSRKILQSNDGEYSNPYGVTGDSVITKSTAPSKFALLFRFHILEGDLEVSVPSSYYQDSLVLSNPAWGLTGGSQTTSIQTYEPSGTGEAAT